MKYVALDSVEKLQKKVSIYKNNSGVIPVCDINSSLAFYFYYFSFWGLLWSLSYVVGFITTYAISTSVVSSNSAQASCTQ